MCCQVVGTSLFSFCLSQHFLTNSKNNEAFHLSKSKVLKVLNHERENKEKKNFPWAHELRRKQRKISRNKSNLFFSSSIYLFSCMYIQIHTVCTVMRSKTYSNIPFSKPTQTNQNYMLNERSMARIHICKHTFTFFSILNMNTICKIHTTNFYANSFIHTWIFFFEFVGSRQ